MRRHPWAQYTRPRYGAGGESPPAYIQLYFDVGDKSSYTTRSRSEIAMSIPPFLLRHPDLSIDYDFC